MVAYPVGRQGRRRNAAAIAAPWLTGAQQTCCRCCSDWGRRCAASVGPGERRPIAGGEVAGRPAVVLLCEGDVVAVCQRLLCLVALASVTPTVALRLIPRGITRAGAAAAAPIAPGPAKHRAGWCEPHRISPRP